MMFVSVVMPAYNVERFVEATMESILAQTHRDFELIIVDDGSTDRTLEILESFRRVDPRVCVLTQENSGVAAARNAGISEARAQWIAVMDADDIMEPYRLERQIAFIEDHPDLAIASSLVTWIDPDGRELGRSQSNLTTEQAVLDEYRKDPVLILSHPTCFIRRDILLRVGGYRTEFWASSDIDLFNRIADAGGKILVQPEYLVRYRIHSGSVTGITSGWDSTLHRWIRQCSLHRQQGLPEPTLEEYRMMWRDEPWYRRLNQRRQDVANILYNKATFSYSVGHLAAPAMYILLSSAIDPRNAPGKVWRKFVRPRFFRSRVYS
jgi:glycosyltransferase involved in cell wall biosynthesis